MAIAVETLEKLERRITITLPLADVRAEVEKRLKARAKTAKAPGFRPGKVPLNMVAAQYGYQLESDVLNDKVGRAFNEAANENNLRVAGFPRIEPNTSEGQPEGILAFDAVFEVYPEVVVGDLSAVAIEKFCSEVTEEDIDHTLNVLRKQRTHYHVKGQDTGHGAGDGDLAAKDGDRLTLDFVGTVDAVEFPGGKAEDFVLVLGEGRMLPEFEAAAQGLKLNESKTFPLAFPEDYHGKDVAGKTAEFTITLKQIEWPHMPAVDEQFAQSLGIADGSIETLRKDIRENLERESKARTDGKTKDSVMDALLQVCTLDLPKVLVEQDTERLIEMTRQDMTQRGMKVKDIPFPPELFNERAERRVRLGLILAEIVKANNLQPDADQVKAQVEEFAKSYEDPVQVIKYYFSDRQRLAEVEALVLEENVVAYVLDKAQVSEKSVPFKELMDNNQQA